MKKWARANYQPNLPLDGSHRVTASSEHIELSKNAAAEGMVLLKNQNETLPLSAGSRVALFGKGTFDYVKGGGGSGDVTTLYAKNLYDGLKELGDIVSVYEPLADYYRSDVEAQYLAGAAPGMTREPDLPDTLLHGARSFCDTAVITISRFSGEGWDRSSVEYDAEFNPWGDEVSMPKISAGIFPDGDFFLTASEKQMIDSVKSAFPRVIVVLNIGGVIDTSWIADDDAIGAALLAWQAGMEGGAAMASILTGLVNPSGKLADTFARTLEDYPSTGNFHESPHYVEYTDDIYVGYRYFETIPGMKESVVYPFGYGLSYTTFSIEPAGCSAEENTVTVSADVVNTGRRAGREVIQLYLSAPQGKLGRPARELAAFRKTRTLQPGESERVTLTVKLDESAAYDDLGKIRKSAFILEAGDYDFYIGSSVRCGERPVFTHHIDSDLVTRQMSARLVPTDLPRRLRSDGSMEELPTGTTHDFNECLFEKMTPGTEEALTPAVRAGGNKYVVKTLKDGAHPLKDVVDGVISLDEFAAQLSDEDLLHLLGGQPNKGVANTFGIGNLPEYGIPSVMTADGPAGLRVAEETGVKTTAWPCATLIACTWNPETAYAVGRAGAAEVIENNISVWLTPAVCIHRNPLCGRNFEYYSEDPLISGKIGAAAVRGIQSRHAAAAVKHFAANNKETNRKHSDSRVSERALREIYLRAFEIIVRESDPWMIMSSYNIINGHRASESHELLEDILRGEWGFRGVVTSDWWTRGEHYKEILAGNDLKMATGFPSRVNKAIEMGALGREDLLRCAKRVLNLLLKLD